MLLLVLGRRTRRTRGRPVLKAGPCCTWREWRLSLLQDSLTGRQWRRCRRPRLGIWLRRRAGPCVRRQRAVLCRSGRLRALTRRTGLRLRAICRLSVLARARCRAGLRRIRRPPILAGARPLCRLLSRLTRRLSSRLLLTSAVVGRAGLLKLLAATVLAGLRTGLARTARRLTGLTPRRVRIDAARIGASEVALLAHDPLSGRLRRVDLADKTLIALLLLRRDRDRYGGKARAGRARPDRKTARA